tara:strand:+ start:3030 stop:3578 length:549 start_codon:yes stop_codon:yes gene_type:complete
MKIYTKKGDNGTTSLIGGTRVPKHHLRIESYGTVDELNSYIGLIRDQNIDSKDIEVLLEIQDRLFTIGSHLAAEPGKSKMVLPELFNTDITFLENEIDRMDDGLEEMRSFVLPGGNTVVSYSHIARCVCRRAERVTVNLSEESEVDEKIISYLNRLSDYLFTLSRKLTKDLDAKEIAWIPKK